MWFDENFRRELIDRDPTVVVIGSGGRLGSLLAAKLADGQRVVGFDRSSIDLANAGSIERALASVDYDFLFLTAALTDVDYCETHPREAYLINAEAPGIIAEISAEKSAHVTYISTDMVFDGLKADPYLESDAPMPISVYGHSKYDGEQRVLEASAENLVARVSWLFGPSKPGFPEWIVRQAMKCEHPTLPFDKVARPTYTPDLVEWLAALVFGGLQGPASGVMHLCNEGPCTWQEWGEACLEHARTLGISNLARRITGVSLAEVEAFIASRPLRSALCTERFSAHTGIEPRPWDEALRHFVIQSGEFRV